MKVFKRGIKNIIFGIVSQFIILALGIVIPRLFVTNYGSDVNGLFNTIGQIFNYVALLEAGLGAATVQALYAPVASNDRGDISSILSATKIYYRKVSLYYFLCVVALSFLYPMIVNTDGIKKGLFGMSSPVIIKISVGLVTFFAGLAGVVNFYFQATLKQLMAAEGRNYVNSNINLMVNILLSSAKIALVLVGADIVIIQFSYLVIRLLQMVIYMSYFRRHYAWVDFKATPNFNALSQRNAFLVHQITTLINSSTDTIVISIAIDLAAASIYSVYNLVTNSIHTLCETVNNSLLFILGITYHSNKERYLRLHDAYNTYYITFIFSIMSVCYLLYRPFISIYMRNADIDYNVPYVALLFCLIQLLSSTRAVSNNLISIAGHMRQTMWHSMLEAAINLTVSLILVLPLGIQGVLLGTVVSLLYRTNDIILYTDLKILKRNPMKTYKPVIINFMLFGLTVWLEKVIGLELNSYMQFIKYGVIFGVTVIPVFFIVNSVLAPKEFGFVFDILKRKLPSKLKKSKA
jgi:O-antigen/teichoic acid export membrane protein